MNATVVVNTCDRLHCLRRLLPALERQRGAEFELIVVVGPSGDGTERHLARRGYRLKLLSCPTRNLSASRNIGIAAAAGDLVLFIDDDALPLDSAWIARAIAAFEADPDGRLGAVTGAVFQSDAGTLECGRVWADGYGFVRYYETGEPEGPDAARWRPCVCGGNVAFRRSALREIGGFDEFYRYYLDETDTSLRLWRCGYRISAVEGFAIRHYPERAAAPGASPYLRDWSVIAASDAYFGLKNGGGAPLSRLGRALAAAPRKHYVAELQAGRRQGRLGRVDWARMTLRWMRGAVAGAWAGLRRARALGRFGEPPPFLPFNGGAAETRGGGPLRIALLTKTVPGQPGYGGVGRYTFDLARALHERGHEVHLFCRAPAPRLRESLGFFLQGVEAPDAGESLAPGRPVLGRNLAYAVALARRLASAERAAGGFDVVHASNWDAEAAALLREGRRPVVMTLVTPLAQTIAAEGWEEDRDLAACVEVDRWQIRRATAVCVPSEGVLATYAKRLGLARADLPGLRVVPLGIDPSPLDPAPRADGEPKRLLFVGRLERRKGIHVLLAVLPELLTRFPDWACDLVGADAVEAPGGGTYRERFLAAGAGAAWLPRVAFHGEVSEARLRAFYRACDLFVAPSLFESFGLIYHEAMQFGKAVVGTRAGGVPETVADGDEGLLVEPGQMRPLAEALARLMSDDALRARLGAAGARRVRERQNAATMAAAMERVYRAVLAVRPAGPAVARAAERE